jgi:dephospho-CoA kinase
MRVAVTGGIAEGKSTVLAMLDDLGFQTASSDQFARQAFYEAEVQAQFSKLTGLPLPVSPADLRGALVGSTVLRRAVNRIMHPHVVASIEESAAQFIEVPLLIETCLQTMFDEVWVVTCGPEEQTRRLDARYGQESGARLIDTQLSSFVKTPFADVVVRTNLPIETVKRYVEQVAQSVRS